MKTEIQNIQRWAMTGTGFGSSTLRDGFYTHCDMSSLDAPEFLPSGSTVDNVIDWNELGGRLPGLEAVVRYVVGSLAHR